MIPSLALLLDALSLVGIVAYLISLLVALLPSPCGSAAERAHELRRRLFLPLVGAILVVALGFWPAIRSYFGGSPDHCAVSLHHPHLCWVHGTGAGGQVHDWVVIIILAVLAGISLWQLIHWSQALGRLKLLEMIAEPARERDVRARLAAEGLAWPGDIQVVAIGLPVCFMFGVLRPRLVISRMILDELSASDLAAMTAHELAHLKRRDNLWRLLGQLAILAHLPGLGQRAFHHWGQAAEMACDEAAADHLGSPVPIAEALVRFQRLINRCNTASEPPLRFGVAFADSGSLEARVHQLMAPPQSKSSLFRHWPWGLAILALWQIDSLHHVLESLLAVLHV